MAALAMADPNLLFIPVFITAGSHRSEALLCSLAFCCFLRALWRTWCHWLAEFKRGVQPKCGFETENIEVQKLKNACSPNTDSPFFRVTVSCMEMAQ